MTKHKYIDCSLIISVNTMKSPFLKNLGCFVFPYGMDIDKVRKKL